MAARTLYDKLWDSHLVNENDDGSSLLYIDRHVLHEVTSPQAFEGLRIAGRGPWRLDTNIATPDHNISTDRSEREAGVSGIPDEISRIQVQTLDDNCDHFGIKEFKMKKMVKIRVKIKKIAIATFDFPHDVILCRRGSGRHICFIST